MKAKSSAFILVIVMLAAAAWRLSSKGPSDVDATDTQAARTSERAKRTTRSSSPFEDDPGDQAPSKPVSYAGVVLGVDGSPRAKATVFARHGDDTLQAESGKDGGFELTLLSGKRYALWAEAEHARSVTMSVRAGDEFAASVLRLMALERWDVRAHDSSGRATVSGADVRVELSIGGTRSCKTDSEGACALEDIPLGSHAIVTKAAGYTATREFFTADGSVGAREIRLSLPAESAIVGRVRTRAGVPVAGAHVSATNAATLDERLAAVAAVTSDAQGNFRLSGLLEGAYRVRADSEHFVPTELASVAVQTGRVHEGVELVLDAGARVDGRVTDGSGNSLAGAKVMVVQPTAGFKAPWTRSALSDASGRYVVDGLPAGEFQLIASHEGSVSERVPFSVAALGTAVHVNIQVSQAGTISGQVVSGAGPVADAVVKARFVGGSFAEDYERSTLTDEEGRFELEDLLPGSHRLHAEWSGTKAVLPPEGDHVVMADTGREGVVLRLEEYGSVSGAVRFQDGEVPASFEVWAGPQPAAVDRDEAGVFEAHGLLPGKYDVAVRGPSFEPVIASGVQVRAGEITHVQDIIVTRGRTLSGRVVDGKGQGVAGAEVMAASSWMSDAGEPASEGTRNSATFKSSRTDPSGNFSLQGLSDKGLLVVAHHPQHGRSEPAPIDALQGRSVTLTLQAGTRVSGQVRLDGQPVEGALITAISQVSQASAVFSGRTGKDGLYELAGVPAGKYRILAGIAARQERAQMSMQELEVPRATPEVQVNFALQSGSVKLVVAPPADVASYDASVVVAGANGTHSGRITSQGPLELAGIVPGAYRLCVQRRSKPGEKPEAAAGQDCRPLDVAGPGEQRVQL